MKDLKNVLAKDLVEYRSSNQVAYNLIKVILGEIQTLEKRNGKELSDEAAYKIVKNMHMGCESNVKISRNDSEKLKYESEVKILDKYIVKLDLLSEEQCKNIIVELLKDQLPYSKKHMGIIMKHFNANYPMQFDGKVLSKILDALI